MVNAIQQNPSMGSYLPSVKILTKHIITFGKFFRRMQVLSHQRFALLPMCGDLVLFYWSQVVDASSSPEGSIAGKYASYWGSQCIDFHVLLDSDDARYPLRFLVQGMALFKENLAQWSVLRRDGTPNKNCMCSRKSNLFTSHLLCMTSTITRIRGECSPSSGNKIYAAESVRSGAVDGRPRGVVKRRGARRRPMGIWNKGKFTCPLIRELPINMRYPRPAASESYCSYPTSFLNS